MKRMRYVLAALAMLCADQGHLHAQSTAISWQMKPVNIQTRWGQKVSPTNALPEYPRPQMVRGKWENLNGLWEYRITDKDAPAPSSYEGQILVPFPLESALSGVQRPLKPTQRLWYKRNITKPDTKGDKRVLLHFGAVDWQATVYVNDKEIGQHSGGYQNFSFDITDVLKSGNNKLVVSVYDPTDQGPNPHGKQVLTPAGIMYTASSGIWQTVWLETVSPVSIQSLKITPDIDRNQLALTVSLHGENKGHSIKAIIKEGAKLITSKSFENYTTLSINNAHLWSPDDPHLYDLQIQVLKDGKVVDEVKSYFGMRKINIQKDEKGIDRIFLNNKYIYNLGTLDQGFWPEGLYTAPTDEALKFDIKAAKAMGFNTIRKHIKIEPARWYYYTDKLGMLVWQDMINPGDTSSAGKKQFEKENKENIEQLYNYPSIITWVLFNESWGSYDQSRLTKWVKDTDPSRLTNGHSGAVIVGGKVIDSMPIIQKSINSDMTDIHSYPPPAIPTYLKGKAMVLGEFGGIAVSVENHLWDDITAGFGYGNIVMPPTMLKNYNIMQDSLKAFEEQGLSGSIYTQPFDVEAEQNGLITYDREIIKVPVAMIRDANRKLWPTTANYATSTKGFIAKVADISILSYASRLKLFKQGKRDSIFLRNLALIAEREKDMETARLVAIEYINNLKTPLRVENLKFIQKFTNNTKDQGFRIFTDNAEKIDYILGENSVRSLRLKAIDGEIYPIIFINKFNGDFSTLESDVVKRYGDNGQQVIWTLQALYYYGHKDFSNFVIAKEKLHNKYPDAISTFDMNNDAWFLFENASDKKQLETALTWSKKVIEREPTANYYDTYANILYKLGRKNEAINIQKKGITLNPGNGSLDAIKANLEKMEKGEPTWK